ncbi:glycosyltransferase [Aureitalea marina]|uniref:Glycosyl transferase family 2 n=1 Tax=Aureitalea marina TaxID=930804 RepID=A0A2S7KR31_9FLAO|nr:glycosyltransferase family 2 protein [Aureitalea marina]PQB05084.1 hypothetical protein BST85_09400 [Aureitalea marina]
MEVIISCLATIELLLFAYLAVSGAYILVFALAGRFRKKQSYLSERTNRIAVLIPGYKEDAVIVDVARQALEQDYPADHYRVYVIADSFQDRTLKQLSQLDIELIEVSFEQSTKSKALNKAMERITLPYDMAVILDADNVMKTDFLNRINQAYNNGHSVIQGRRLAKNDNTAFAILDGISEAINNHIFRQGHRAMGLSSGIIGSGMAFEYSLFKTLMKSVQAVGGFDKELEFRLFQQGVSIEYLKDALVFDEKIQQVSDFKNQRRRWLSTNGIYLKKFYRTAWKQLIGQGNLDMADKLFQMVLPPRVLLLGSVFLLSGLIALLQFSEFGESLWVPANAWYALLGAVVLTFGISTPRSYYNWATLKAALAIPKAFVVMFGLLFKLKGANKEFIHTQHHQVNS